MSDARVAYDSSATFEPVNTPARYPAPAPDAQGVWRHVLDTDGQPIGVIWTDNSKSAGIRWITQTDAVFAVYRDLHRSCAAGIDPGTAYRLALKVRGAKFGKEHSGPVAVGVHDTMQILMGATEE